MADSLSLPPFDHGSSAKGRLNAARARLATALLVSALLHLWFAGGTDMETPRRPRQTTIRPLSVRLEQAATPARLEQQAKDDVALSDPSRRDSASRKNVPHLEKVPHAVEQRRHGTQREKPVVAAARPTPRPSPVDATYYPASELDVYPMPAARVVFGYPQKAADDRVSGEVLLMLLIDEAGNVDGVTVVAAEPSGYFEDAARQAFNGLRFSPARKGERAVKSRVFVNVDFASR